MFCRFDAPASYTGEDMLEIYSHGGPAGTGLLLREIFLAGARGAGPGSSRSGRCSTARWTL